MSGPKHFEWFVEPGALVSIRGERIALTAEQEKYWMEIGTLNDNIIKCKKKFEALITRLKTMGSGSVHEARHIPEGGAAAEAFEKVKSQLLQELNALNINTYQNDIPSKRNYFNKLEARYQEFLEIVDKQLVPGLKLVQNAVNERKLVEQEKMRLAEEQKTLEEEQEFTGQFSGLDIVQKDGMENITFKNSNSKAASAEAIFEEPDWETYLEAAGEVIRSMDDSLCIFPQERGELDKTFQSMLQVVNDGSMKGPFKKDVLEMRLDALRCSVELIRVKEPERLKVRNEMQQLYAKYASLCSVLGVQPRGQDSFIKKLTKNETDTLKAEIKRLETEIMKKEESDYVAANIDEVMKEMGYDIVSSNVFTERNAEVEQLMYTFKDRSAITVYTSESGSVMFEVVGTDSAARTPDLEDQRRLVGDMQSFCSSYDVIKQKLAERGIRVRNEMKLPADRQFAKIIELNQEVKKKERTKRKGVGSRRQMRLD